MPTANISVPKHEMQECNDILRGETKNHQDGVITTYTAKFENGIEADIKVVGVPYDDETGNSYVDPVLFDKGDVVSIGDAGESLDGEYHFPYKGTSYSVHLS